VKKIAVGLIFSSLAFSSLSAFAVDVNVKAFELKTAGAENRLSIIVAGNLNDNPHILVKDKTLFVTIPNAHVARKIQKTINGAAITAAQADRETVTVKAILPYSLAGKESQVNIMLKDGSVDVSFPRGAAVTQATASKVGRSPAIVAADAKETEINNVEAEKLDESYLSSLVKENEKMAAEKHPEQVPKGAKEAHADTALKNDRVNLTQSGVDKAETKSAFNKEEGPKSGFSLTGYIGKFVAFLSLMVLGFYGVLTLFKKGVIKKGSLGFLNSTKLVEVISTTHVAPKRTLMMVKAHKQVFLVSNTEQGMTLISEIQDVTGLIKNGEEELTGSNFDTNLYTANKKTKEFKLKEDTIASDYSLDDMLADAEESAANSTMTNAAKAIEKAPVKDQVRFSDQIKTKIKNMKQIQ
jgi:flagellar biogenesis protein FliO